MKRLIHKQDHQKPPPILFFTLINLPSPSVGYTTNNQ